MQENHNTFNQLKAIDDQDDGETYPTIDTKVDEEDVLAKVQEGFSSTGGIAKKFVEDTMALAVELFKDTTEFEQEITSPDTMLFREEHAKFRQWVMGLFEEARLCEDICKASRH